MTLPRQLEDESRRPPGGLDSVRGREQPEAEVTTEADHQRTGYGFGKFNAKPVPESTPN